LAAVGRPLLIEVGHPLHQERDLRISAPFCVMSAVIASPAVANAARNATMVSVSVMPLL
jgi:hypothetical protein